MPVLITPLEKTFDYYANFEEYPKRYPKYCSRLDIIEKDGNEVITKEIWNMTTPSQTLDHVTIMVKYTLLSYKEIQYEVLEGYGTGKIKGAIKFTKKDNGFTQVEEKYIPLEILAEFLHDRNSPWVMHMHDHFMWQNMRLLEGKKTPYISGDLCPHCKKGTLSYYPKNEKTQDENKFYETERFECDRCCKIATNQKVNVYERINHY